jgi:zinc/manganese transport system substrate-binding protein
VVNGGEVVGLKAGDNPHIWYGPDFVYKVADNVTAALKQLAPEAASYFDQQNQTWHTAMQPYDAEVASVKAKATGKTYGATESVFDYMAAAVGLKNLTPQGYQNAAASGSEPAPADLNDFQNALQKSQINVLIYNTQTEGAGPKQIRDVAKKANVPIVDVTETVKPGTKGFIDWQLGQLQQLGRAFG